MTNPIADNLTLTHQRMVEAAEAANREPDSIQLLAVSKTKPVSDIVLAYAAGQRHFGENYVQEGVDKILATTHLTDITWHFIGPLQSNKSALVAKYFAWCQSIDRLKIAKRLNDQRSSDKAPLNITIQVNIDGEASKSGVLPADILPLAQAIADMPHLTLRGIMAIPKASPEAAEQAQTLSQLHAIYTELQLQFSSIDTLSVGMSTDLAPAIAHGSTMVRVGTGIFGARNLPQHK
jgi:pyridoxal phosphate enzyme (YggS family)